jgi:glycosyltransferase involved in cell wall biosynthesis
LRVHILIDSLTWGGAETLLSEYAIGAREAGIEVSVGYLNERAGAAGRLREVGVEPMLVPIRSMLGRADRALVRRHVAEAAPDLLHTHLGYSDFLGGLAARALGIPSVATIHVMHWDDTLREQTKARIIALARRRCHAKVLAVSEAARRHYLDKGWDRPDHLITVHNGIVGQSRPGARERVRAELGLADDDLVLTMVTVLRLGKGHEIAAEAVQRLSARHPRLKLVVMGEGPDRAELTEQLSFLGDRVTLTGHRDDVMDVLAASDILLHPSRFDAFPTALLEAAAAARPAVATNVGGIPEIVEDGVTGTLIDAPPTTDELVDALGPMVGDASLREAIGRRARERFEASFTIERWFERLLPVYEEAIAAGEPGSPRAWRSGGAAAREAN